MDSLISRIQLTILVRTLWKSGNWTRINRLSKRSILILIIHLLNSCSRLLIATRSPYSCWHLCWCLKTLFPWRILSALFFSSFQLYIFFSWWIKIWVCSCYRPYLFTNVNLIKKVIQALRSCASWVSMAVLYHIANILLLKLWPDLRGYLFINLFLLTIQ